MAGAIADGTIAASWDEVSGSRDRGIDNWPTGWSAHQKRRRNPAEPAFASKRGKGSSTER
jgi:hypothetical protein